MNLARGSIFNIKIDFEKSLGSFIYDKNTKKSYLDFFGMYASLPLGYNHDIFKTKEFQDEILRVSNIKVTNCEFISEETEEFDKIFSKFSGKEKFSNFHYCSTGALAVEAAIKVCLHYKQYKNLNILSFKNSFHGVNSYGGFITDRFFSSNTRLAGLPEIFSTKCNFDLEEVENHLADKNNPVTCLFVEPIQCTAGDIHHDPNFFTKLRLLCNKYDIPLIFDEIQTGFGVTGKLWFFEHLDIIPDIVLFGKKTQVSGLMVVEKFNDIFNHNNINRLEVTWNSDTIDMVRSKYIIKAYEQYNILDNVKLRSEQMMEILSIIDEIKNLRYKGLLFGFDFNSQQERDKFVKTLYHKGMICNTAGKLSVRLRPNLAITEEEVVKGCALIKEALKEIK